MSLFVYILYLLVIRSESLKIMSTISHKDIRSVIGDYNTFLSNSLEILNLKYGINIIEDTNFEEIDHICYRCSTTEQYENLKTKLLSFGNQLIESLIGNRPISIFKLNEPIFYNRFRIDLIELPAPKLNSPYLDGLEHFEIVVCGKGKFSISDMKEKEYLEHWSSKFPHISFDTRALSKDINCDLAISITDSTSCKFHCFPLNEIIKYEKDNNLIKPIL